MPRQNFGGCSNFCAHTQAKHGRANRSPKFWLAPDLVWRAWAQTKQPLSFQEMQHTSLKKKNAAHSNFQVQNTLYAFSFFIALISIVLCKCLLQRP
jgi:hypothetical protein